MTISNKVKGVLIGTALSALVACGPDTMYRGPVDDKEIELVHRERLGADYTELRVWYSNGDRLHLRDDNNDGRIDRVRTWQNGIESDVSRSQAEGTELRALFGKMQKRYDELLREVKYEIMEVGE